MSNLKHCFKHGSKHGSKLSLKSDLYAFTLIELLVVISIIALMIGILLPALASARQSAYRVQCLSQMRQVGMGMHMYLSVFKGYYFPNHHPDDPIAAAGMPVVVEIPWYERVASVTDFEPKHMFSPGDPYAGKVFKIDGTDTRIVSYSLNGYFGVMGANIRNLNSPSSVVFAALRGDTDFIGKAEGDPVTTHLAFHPWEAIPFPYNGTELAHWWSEGLVLDRYLKTSNYLFADGHAEVLGEEGLQEAAAYPGDRFYAGEIHP